LKTWSKAGMNSSLSSCRAEEVMLLQIQNSYCTLADLRAQGNPNSCPETGGRGLSQRFPEFRGFGVEYLGVVFRNCDQLLCGDLYIGHYVGVAALVTAAVECGRCVTIGSAIGYRSIGVQCAGVHDCVDLVERTAASGVGRAIDVVSRNARRSASRPGEVH